jgi:hypothetical protein
MLHQGQHAGGFSGLPGGVQDKVLFLGNEGFNGFEIKALKWWKAVMVCTIHRTRCIEKSHGSPPARGVLSSDREYHPEKTGA